MLAKNFSKLLFSGCAGFASSFKEFNLSKKNVEMLNYFFTIERCELHFFCYVCGRGREWEEGVGGGGEGGEGVITTSVLKRKLALLYTLCNECRLEVFWLHLKHLPPQE